MDLVDPACVLDAVDDPVDHRAPTDRQQRLRGGVGQRPQTRRVAAGEQEHLHASTTAPASESAYGASWTPCSVTTAVISSAGVTSNAGLRAGNRSLISAGSRCSIGISSPRAVRWSTVELGATTKNGISWWRASTASE